MAPDIPHDNDPLLSEGSGRGTAADWISRAVDWTRRTLQTEYRDSRELAQRLEEDHEEVIDLWSELSFVANYRWTAPVDLAQNRQIADLCLSRLAGALGSETPVPLEVRDEDEIFSFAVTLAEYGARQRISLDDLIQYILLLRRAIQLQLRKYGSAAPHFAAAVDWFIDSTLIALTRRWLSASRATTQWEESQLAGLLSVSREMLSTLDPTSAANRLVLQAQELAEADGAVLLALDAGGERFDAAAVATASAAVRAATPLPVEASASGQAIRAGQIVTSLDLGPDGPRSVFVGSPPLPEEPGSYMSAPVWLGGRVVGALEVANFEPRLYAPDQMKLLDMLAAQAGLVWENAARHRQSLEEERARNLREIQMAQKVQRALLSENALEHGRLAIGACLEPSREVGGDYYDFFVTGTDARQVALHIGDVSGKGIPAALLVAMAKYVVRSHALPGVPSPGQVLQQTNATFCTDLSEEMAMFVTACYALVECDGRELRYASAGHPPPLIIRGSLMQPVEEPSGAAPLNLVPGQRFPEHSVALHPADLVIFYTDGVLEARNSRGEWFGLSGLRRSLRHCRDEEPVAIARAVVDAVRRFQAGQPLADDTTVLVLKVRR